jgi:hypothetical protein
MIVLQRIYHVLSSWAPSAPFPHLSSIPLAGMFEWRGPGTRFAACQPGTLCVRRIQFIATLEIPASYVESKCDTSDYGRRYLRDLPCDSANLEGTEPKALKNLVFTRGLRYLEIPRHRG